MSNTIQSLLSSNLIFLEIELKGQIDLNTLILSAFQPSTSEIKIIKASIEYFGKKSFGNIIIQYTQNEYETIALFDYLTSKNIKYNYLNLN